MSRQLWLTVVGGICLTIIILHFEPLFLVAIGYLTGEAVYWSWRLYQHLNR